MAIEVTWQLPAVDAYLLGAHGAPRSLTAEEGDVLWEYAAEVERYVVERWPVDTGTSRDSFAFTISTQPGEIAATFTNDMFYAKYVTEKGTTPVSQGGTSLYAELYPAALDAYRDNAIRDLKAAIDRTEATIARASSERGRRAATLRAYLPALVG